MGDKNGTAPPPYGFVPPPSAPPSYAQAVGGVPPVSPFTPQTNTTVPTAIVTTVVPIGPHTTHMICPSCHAEINTQTRTEPGPIAYLSGLVIALLGCWLGCCLIPCCIDECMDVHHTCPNCKAYLGRHRR
ncbi:LITAF domain-containing protein [Lutzomyia longipalpis]|nr:LITAF domain-containing protein [Lutzomyia longipalpis]